MNTPPAERTATVVWRQSLIISAYEAGAAMEQPRHFVGMTISSQRADADPPDKMIELLARWLKRSSDDIRHALKTKQIKISKVDWTDGLNKVVTVFRRNGLNVEIYPLPDDPASGQRAEHSSTSSTPTTTRGTALGSHQGLGRLRNWKKGEVIEGLYEVLGSAAGGMGKVYFVFHRLWKMMLAIKTPLQRSASSEARIRRLLREAELWVNLGLHPNIATCYYARVIDGLPRLFIEYVDKGTLEDWSEKGRLKELHVLVDLMLQFCHGMIHAEQAGIIHRDVKPANCLITSDGMLKITDFGLVKRVGDAFFDSKTNGISDLTQPIDEGITVFEDGILGSPWYMAPERFKEVGEDIRSDIYSFGVMLYEIAVGSMPFQLSEGISLYTLARSHTQEQPTDPRSLRPDLPESLIRIIMTCLEKRPENRYPSFVDLCTAFEALSLELWPDKEPRTRPNLLELKADSLNNQAVSLLDLGREKEAKQLLEAAFSTDIEHLEAIYNLNSLRWRNSEISDREILDHLESLNIEQRETDEFAHLIGLISLQRGDSVRAVDLLEKAQNRNPHYRERWNTLGGNPKSYVDSMGFNPVGFWDSFAGHVKYVRSIGFPNNPDSDAAIAFSVGEDRSIRLWDLTNGRCIKNLRTFTFVPVAGAFSPDGKLAATAYGDAFKTLDLWDLNKGRLKYRYQGMGALGVAFSRDSRLMVAFDGEGRVRILKTDSDEIWAEFRQKSFPISAIALVDNGKILVFGGEDGTLSAWAVESQEELFHVQAHLNSLRFLKVSRRGTEILTGGIDKTIRLWDVNTGREIRRFIGHRSTVNDACFTPDDRYVVSASSDGSLKIWESAGGRCFRTLLVSGEEFSCCEISPDGGRLLSGGSKGSVLLWSLDIRWFDASFLEPAVCRPKTFQELTKQHDTFKRNVALFHAQRKKGAADQAMEAFESIRDMPGFCWSAEAVNIRKELHKTAKRTRLKSWFFIRSFRGHQDAVVSIAASADGTMLITGSSDGTVGIWDVVTGRKLAGFSLPVPVSTVRFIPDTQRILALGIDGILRICSFDGNMIFEIDDINPPIKISYDKVRASALSSGNTLLSIDLNTGTVKNGSVTIPGSGFTCFSDDNRILFSLRDGRRILRWSVADGRNLGAFRDLGRGITAVSPMKNTDGVIAGMESGEVVIFPDTSGIHVTTLRGHTDGVRVVMQSDDRTLCLSGADDCSLRVWHIAEEKCVAVLEGHAFPVQSLDFFLNHSMIASGASDGAVRLWGLEWDWIPWYGEDDYNDGH